MKIELFKPLQWSKYNINYCNLEQYTDGQNRPLYASKGRYAIVHILRSLSIFEGSILISGYMCSSVEETLLEYGYKVGYFDIDLRDLNPSKEDIEKCLSNGKYVAVIVPSLYGNPADLETIYDLCCKYKAVMIDDAAQSCGAILGNKKVGSYGDGGFIAFSPGKPTAGHMGAFFWSKLSNQYCINRKRNFMYHFSTFADYWFNRYHVYKTPKILRKYISFACRLLKGPDSRTLYDDISLFEKDILGGIVKQNENIISLRNQIATNFYEKFKQYRRFRIIRNLRGIPNNCKIVLLCENKGVQEELTHYLESKGIAYFGGYKLPNTNMTIQNCRMIEGCIIELPIELHSERMKYLFDCIDHYINNVI